MIGVGDFGPKAGAALSDEQPLKMNWLVEGVQGRVDRASGGVSAGGGARQST